MKLPRRSLVWLAPFTLLILACAPRPADDRLERLYPSASALAVDPRVGVHTRLTDEVEEDKIARTLRMAREMGAGSIVEYFPWAYFEPEPGRWWWGHSDVVVGEAERQGLRLYARIDMVPEWARPVGSSSRLLPEERSQEYANAVASFAARYEGRIAGIVVWNEPNVSFEWGFRPVDPAGYVQLLRAAYLAVKEAAPSVRVFAAGLAPTLERSAFGMDDLEYLDALYEEGAAPWFDGLAAHAYGWQAPPDEAPAPDRINLRRLELLRGVMERHGDAAKPVVLTEGGWNDHPRWTKAVRPGLRLSYTVDAYQMAAERWPWLEAMNLWLFRLPSTAHNYNDGFAFLSPDFTPRPVYSAVQTYVRTRIVDIIPGS